MAATPTASNELLESAARDQPTQSIISSATTDTLILSYLRERGLNAAEQAVREALENQQLGASLSHYLVPESELRKHLVPFWPKKEGSSEENALLDAKITLQSLLSAGVPSNVASLLSDISPGGADDILTSDPADRHEGFRDLESWVEGSLDMYKPEFQPILYPIFVHFYLDLIHSGFRDAALLFYNTFSPSLAAVHQKSLRHFAGLLLPSHVQQDELAQRFRTEKYVLRMSRSGFNLLVGWLTEGYGGEAIGSGDGFSGERGKRGRAAIMRVVNNRLRFEVTSANAAAVTPHSWEESTGLSSSIKSNASSAMEKRSDAVSDTAKKDLKLGPPPIDDNLRQEVERLLREQALSGIDRELVTLDFSLPITTPMSGLESPLHSDLLPRPPTFKMLDVSREVEKIRDARKRIRLDASAFSSERDMNDLQALNARSRSLPSICTYTIHEAADGVPCATFSPDSSLLAVGFSDSYICLWNLKGDKLENQRNIYQSVFSKHHSLQDKSGSTMRKLIGHGGPVYSLSFDPLGGSATAPHYLLSSSADKSIRLWSLDTMANITAYRGHQGPVWDVQWSPLGTYFATGSRDKTARLWSADKISALRVYAGHLGDIDCISFHPNSLYLATGSSDWTCRLWDVQHGSTVRVFVGHQGDVTALALSPDGRYLASAGEDLAINLWDLGSGHRIKKMTGHTASIYSLAFSQESTLLISGSADWTVRCWDVKGAGGTPNRTTGKESWTSSIAGESANTNNRDQNDAENHETLDLLKTYATKRTPIVNVQLTSRNLCLVAGPFLAPDQR